MADETPAAPAAEPLTAAQELSAAEAALSAAQADLQAAPAGAPAVTAVNSAIDAWFFDLLQRPPLSWNTDAYNQTVAARDALKTRLAALFAAAT